MNAKYNSETTRVHGLAMLRKKIEDGLKRHPPQKLPVPFPEAAVAVLVTDEIHPHIILTQRSAKMKTHSGQVAFPGGMRDQNDPDLLATALRETREEIGVDESAIRIRGPLSQVISRYKILVSPFVGLIQPNIPMQPEEGELDAIFKVPVEFFTKTPPVRVDRVTFMGWKVAMPAWNYDRFHIWGMSALILADYLRKVEGVHVG